MRKHVQRVHEKIKNHTCDQCYFKCVTRKELQNHIEAIHSLQSKKLGLSWLHISGCPKVTVVQLHIIKNDDADFQKVERTI